MNKKHKRTGHKNSKSVLNVLKCLMGVLFVIIFNIAALTSQGGNENGVVATSNQKSSIVAEEEVKAEEVKNYVLTVDSDLTIPSNISAEEVEKMLEGTNLSGLGSAFVRAEKEEGVNALYMLGLACLESNYGKSNFAVERNNLYGWCAYDSDPRKSKLF